MGLFGESKRPNIEKMQKQGDVQGLIAALGSEDSEVRDAAQKAIGKMDTDPRVREVLIAALKDEDWKVRAGAAICLTTTFDPNAVEPLIAALKDENPGVRFGAANALCLTVTFTKTGHPHAVEALTDAVAAEPEPELKRELDKLLHAL